MLVELVFNLQLLFVKSIDREEPPKHISVTKYILESIKVGLFLTIYQIIVFQFRCKLQLDSEIVLSFLQIIDKTPVLLDVVQLIAKETNAESADHD